MKDISIDLWCIFRIGDQRLGVELSAVREVLCTPLTTLVPLSHPAIRGLLNLRGDLITAIDLRRRLEMSSRSEDGAEMAVIVYTGDGPMAFIVDEVDDITAVASSDLLTPPPHLGSPLRNLLRATFYSQDQLVLGLDIQQTVLLSSTSDPYEPSV